MMKEKLLLTLVVLIFDVLSVVVHLLAPVPSLLWRWSALPSKSSSFDTPATINHNLAGPPQPPSVVHPLDTHYGFLYPWPREFMGSSGQLLLQQDASYLPASFISLAEAKGVAGLGKAGGDGTGGADKAGTQVPPEVYNALTYAGTAFLCTLSVPLILYGLNKLLNKIEDCFGCGPASKKKKISERRLENQQLCDQNNLGNGHNNKLKRDSSLVGRHHHHRNNHQQQQYSNQDRSITDHLHENYQQHLHNQQHNQQQQYSNNNQLPPQVASFPANKDSKQQQQQHNNNHNRINATNGGGSCGGSRQHSPAVPVTQTDSSAITLPFDLVAQQQDYKKQHTTLSTTPTSTTSALQNNYHQTAQPYIISSPHI